LRTFSKAFGMAGVRLGFAVGQKEIIEKLNQNTQPFPVSSAAMHLAQIALKDKKHIAKSRAFVKAEKVFLQKKLIKLGFKIIPSESNLFLLKVTPRFTGSREFCTLLAEHDVSVVDGNAFTGLNNEYVRLSVRTRETHLKFLRILKIIFKEGL
jgi:histidinol-phosphate/aromatic aminotransferase/cobyric acid decarboxylase-like protein